MTTPPDNPFSALAVGIASVHEIFVSLVAGGFSEDQALRLLAYMISDGIARNEQTPGGRT